MQNTFYIYYFNLSLRQMTVTGVKHTNKKIKNNDKAKADVRYIQNLMNDKYIKSTLEISPPPL